MSSSWSRARATPKRSARRARRSWWDGSTDATSLRRRKELLPRAFDPVAPECFEGRRAGRRIGLGVHGIAMTFGALDFGRGSRGFGLGVGLFRALRRPFQQRLRQHGLAFVPAFPV